ncbi:hypothetical protein GOP47_0023825 [Adiantum capillus-veneris]|uniref:Uncharacterized protein n=1 Tax=Adiantum capillus-veneris TaxID=13818 RepID=A0A9D4U591_ADICA|nr:hypothetical protein GOP47_0023825 [Adiantum capillus-veneris]
MATSLSQQLSWSRHISWTSLPPRSVVPCAGGSLWIEAGAGKKRVPRTESSKVLNLRSIKKLTGTTERPRLLVFCSEKHLYAHIVDDRRKETLVSASTAQHTGTTEEGSTHPILDAAKKLGEEVAMECLKMGFSRVIYYRHGSLHWERVRTFRLAAEDFGLEFVYPK